MAPPEKTTLPKPCCTKPVPSAPWAAWKKAPPSAIRNPLEKAYQHSLNAAIVHLASGDTRIHLIDTPGLPDFIGRAIGALPAVETAAVVISAQNGNRDDFVAHDGSGRPSAGCAA